MFEQFTPQPLLGSTPNSVLQSLRRKRIVQRILIMSLRELGTSAKAKLVELTAVWARELMSGGQAEAVHCHMLFHLPPQSIRSQTASTGNRHLSTDQTSRSRLLGR